MAHLGVPLTAALSGHGAPLTKHSPPPRLQRAPAHHSLACPAPLDCPPPSGDVPPYDLASFLFSHEAGRAPAASLTEEVSSRDLGSNSHTPAGLGVGRAGPGDYPFRLVGGSSVTGMGAQVCPPGPAVVLP